PPRLYSLSLHDALPICPAVAVEVLGYAGHWEKEEAPRRRGEAWHRAALGVRESGRSRRVVRDGSHLHGGGPRLAPAEGSGGQGEDRKSTRLNSSHDQIS